jgi:hypothetical protein
MNKLIPFVLIFLFSAFMAAGLPDLIALDSEWINEYSQPIGTSLSVIQGDNAEYYTMIQVDSNTIGYKVWLSQNGDVVDTIIPHRIINDDHYFAYEGMDTSDYAPGNYIVKVGANNDGIEDAYQKTEYLSLEILPVQVENHPPYTPHNPNPVDGTTGVNTDVVLSWEGGDPDGDKVTYDLHIKEEGSAEWIVYIGLGNEEYSPSNLQYDTVYVWKVSSYDEEYTVFGPEWEFTTREETSENRPPYAPHYPTPLNGAEEVSYLDVTMSWEGGDPDGDEVTYNFYIGYSEDNLFLFGEDLETPSYHFDELDRLTTFYWKVVSSDMEYDVGGPIWSFTTGDEINENHPPYTPHNPNPVDGSVNQPIGGTLFWIGGDPDGDTVYYDVYFGNNQNNLELLAEDTNTAAVQYPVSEYDTTYYWKVVASDAEYDVEGPQWEFTTREEGNTNEAPDVPVYLNPLNGAEEVEIEVTLMWEGNDPDGDVLHYDVYLGTEYGTLDLVAENLGTELYLVEDLSYETEYFWKIVAKDGEFETSGDIWSFTTKAEDIEENHNPIIEDIEDQRAKCNKNFRLWVHADDSDGDTLTYYDNTDLFDIDSETGEIFFEPRCSDRGTYFITITVVDEHGGEDSEIFRLRIYRDNSGDDDDEDDEDNVESVIEYGDCIDDNDGDSLGIRQVVYTLLDSNSGRFISVQSSQEICQIASDEIPVYEFKGFMEDELVTMILVVIVFLMITIPLALYVFSKLS